MTTEVIISIDNLRVFEIRTSRSGSKFVQVKEEVLNWLERNVTAYYSKEWVEDPGLETFWYPPLNWPLTESNRCCSFKFENKKDAILFKLTWGGIV
jgi:hypothetical protein